MENFRKLTDLVMDAALDFTRQYQKQAMGWAKVEAAACYVKGVQVVRRQCLFLVLQLFCVALLVAGIVVCPLALLYFLPWTATAKILALLVLSSLYIAAPLIFFARLFSEKRWMDWTKSNELIDEVIRKN